MKIKVKLTLGVGVLFAMIVIMSIVGALYINALKNDSENILTANYNSLAYCRDMLNALDKDDNKAQALQLFEENLAKQQKNITEKGEKEATENMTLVFEAFKANPTDLTIQKQIRKDLSLIMDLNMKAIQNKSEIAKLTAKNANVWIALSGTLCFIIAFTLFMNLPHNIANPIQVLTESIKQIASKNYSERVHFESHNEFGDLAKSFNTMAEKLEEYNNSSLSKLLFEKKRIETLINNMNEPVIGLDETKKILFVNTEASVLLGLKSIEMVGKFAQDISVNNDLLRTLLMDLMVNNTAISSKTSKPIKIYADNKESYFEKEIVPITIVPTGETEKKQIGHVIILKNVTPFKELDFAKTNFIATVSHELKTPIASIKMSLKLLESDKTGHMNEDQNQLIESIKEDAERLLKITSELLNMSQVETGNIQLNIQKSNAKEIVQYAIEAVKVPAEQKHIQILSNVDANLPEVKADTEKTAWVLINFLTNAIRYSPENNKVNVTISHEGNLIKFAVTDEGKGIESRYKDKIFDRYFQIPGSPKNGTGLGLAISKEFIEAQGGEIGVDSELGMGSTFYFKMASA